MNTSMITSRETHLPLYSVNVSIFDIRLCSIDFKRIEKSFSKSIKDYETQYKSKHWFYYNDLKNGLFNIKDIQYLSRIFEIF